MKNKLFICLLICLSVLSCKSQKIIVELKSKDIIVFQFKNGNVRLLQNKYMTEVYNGDGLTIATQNWQGYGSGYLEKEYSLLKGKDTMKIKCSCGQETNLFIENLKFEKGNFKLSFTSIKKTSITGKEIVVNKKVNSLFFRNAFTPWEQKSSFPFAQQDISFQKIYFVKADINNTVNIIWKKID